MLKRRVPTSAAPDDDGKFCMTMIETLWLHYPIVTLALDVDDDEDDAFPEEDSEMWVVMFCYMPWIKI